MKQKTPLKSGVFSMPSHAQRQKPAGMKKPACAGLIIV